MSGCFWARETGDNMRQVLRAWLLGGVSLLAAGAVSAQDLVQIAPGQVARGATATVTGHVTCSDTQQPARFATVTLVNVESGGQNRFGFGRRVSGRTDLNGNFTLEAEPGDYYVTAMATGYVSSVAEAEARLGSGASSDDLLKQLPQVHVAENGGGPVNVTIDRGGVISGKLQWDDGSPAAGVSVIAMSTTTPAATGLGGQTDVMRLTMELGGGLGRGAFETSDDRGVFRLTGLAAGSYWVRATVMTPSAEPGGGFGGRFSSITMYAPGKVRRSDAQTITLKAGEERDDVTFMMDLSSLHTVSGQVSATGGGTVASGTVRLTDSQDSTLVRQGFVEPDGSFVVQWVPAGTYTLTVTNASTTASTGYFGRGRGGSSGGGGFQNFQESLAVSDSDVSGVGISLTPVTSSQ
jgi:hypothetical protein